MSSSPDFKHLIVASLSSFEQNGDASGMQHLLKSYSFSGLVFSDDPSLLEALYWADRRFFEDLRVDPRLKGFVEELIQACVAQGYPLLDDPSFNYLLETDMFVFLAGVCQQRNLRDKEGNTFIHKVASHLIADPSFFVHTFDFSCVNNKGQTPLHLLCGNIIYTEEGLQKFSDSIDWVLQHGGRWDTQDSMGKTSFDVLKMARFKSEIDEWSDLSVSWNLLFEKPKSFFLKQQLEQELSDIKRHNTPFKPRKKHKIGPHWFLGVVW